MTKTIYLLRHGHIQGLGKEQRYLGQRDWPLSEEGRRQAQALTEEFRRHRIEAIYSSDLLRCTDTAKAIAGPQGLTPQKRKELREVHMGEWEGCTFADIARQYPEAYRQRGENLAQFRPPGGERFADCRDRVLPIFQEILETPMERIVIVAHAGVNRLILASILGMPMDKLFSLSQDYGCYNLIEARKTGCRVALLNAKPLMRGEKMMKQRKDETIGEESMPPMCQ